MNVHIKDEEVPPKQIKDTSIQINQRCENVDQIEAKVQKDTKPMTGEDIARGNLVFMASRIGNDLATCEKQPQVDADGIPAIVEDWYSAKATEEKKSPVDAFEFDNPTEIVVIPKIMITDYDLEVEDLAKIWQQPKDTNGGMLPNNVAEVKIPENVQTNKPT